MRTINDWYGHFLARRSVPIKREIPPDAATEGFALVIGYMHLTKLVPNARYRISSYFYDCKTSQLFGSPYCTAWQPPDHHDCAINDELFFHCPRIDDGILLILEVVEATPSDRNNEHTAAWAMISVGGFNTPLYDYSNISHDLQHQKVRLHPGSPKVLTFSSKFDADTTAMGVIECTLFTHQKLAEAVDYFPEFCIVGSRDDVPGLRHEDGVPQLSNPIPLPLVEASLDDVGVSFGPHAERIEKTLLDDVNTDRLLSAKPSQMAATQQTTNPQMEVLERRLRIGVHNGYSFLCEPVVVHLSSLDEQMSRTHSLRRKGRPMSRSSSDLRSELNTLFVRSRVSIPRLPDDDRMVIVFALDYLLGMRHPMDNTTSHTQSLIVCWGVWNPFSDRELLADRGRIQASVALTGGPRPNPDESRCYKSLLHLFRQDDSAFTESAPKITIQFNFIVDALRARVQSSHDVLTYETRPSVTPAPRREVIESPTSSGSSPEPEVPRPRKRLSKEKKLEERERRREEQERREEIEEEVYTDKLPPIMKPAIKPSTRHFKSIDRALEHTVIQASPRDNVPTVYEVPWKEYRISNASRSANAMMANVGFSRIVDRHGEPPLLVDFERGVAMDIEREKADRLDSNEIVIQLMAVKSFHRSGSLAPKKVFFSTQFYRFPEITTEEMLVSQTNNNVEPGILMRLDANGEVVKELGAGFMARFIVDRQHSGGQDGDEFISYLNTERVTVEVWDSESLILVGTCVVPLKSLLRRGEEAVQCIVQCPIVSSAIPNQCTVAGLLYLKMANIGHPSSNQIDMVHSRNTGAVVTRRLKRMGEEESASSYRVLAKPLNAAHEDALQRFLHAQRLDIQQRYETIFNEETHDRLRQWERLKTSIPMTAQKTAFKKFVFEEQLEAYRRLRNESKASKLLQAVFKGITLQHCIHPTVGEKQFFEFLLQNTFSDPINCVIEIDEPGLSVVSDSDEWLFYKRQNSLSTPLENNMFHVGQNGCVEVFLKPMESIYVPFIYDDFVSSKYTEGQTTETKVMFRRWDNGDPVSILDLRIDHRPICQNQSIRIYHEQASQCTRHVRITGIHKNRRIGSVRSPDPTVKVAVKSDGVEQELRFSVFCGAATTSRTVLVMLYADNYGYRLLSTWRFVIHALERVDVRSSLGQTTKFTINCQRADSSNQLLQLHSTSLSLQPAVPQPILATGQHLQIPMTYTPDYTGRLQSVCSLVDASARLLQGAWLISAKSELPNISKRYQMKIEIGRGRITEKRLPFVNPYGLPCQFRISSSRQELIQIDNDVIVLEGHESGAIKLHFLDVVQKPVTLEILLFVENCETQQQEETIGLHVSYVDE